MDYEEVMMMRKEYAAKAAKEAINNNKSRIKAINESVETQSVWNKIASLDEDANAFLDFKQKVTDAYVAEGLTVFIDNCVSPELIREEYHQKLVRQLVSNFVKEEGSRSLLNRMKKTSYVLSEMAYIIECQIQDVLEGADKNNTETFKIEGKDKEKFYDKLSKVDVDETINKITNRVREQTNDFINANMEEKARLSTSLEKTKNKVEDVKEKLSDKVNDEKAKEKAQKLEEAYIAQGKRRLSDIVEERSKNVLEHMIYNLSKSAMTNENASRVFVEDAKLNMDKIVEHCETICTFVTALDSLKLMNVDEAFIQDMLNDMKK